MSKDNLKPVEPQDYQTSTAISGFIAMMGWLAIFIAIIAGFYIYNEVRGFGMMAIPVCGAVVLVGLILIVAGQSLRAQLDTANATRQMLQIIRSKRD